MEGLSQEISHGSKWETIIYLLAYTPKLADLELVEKRVARGLQGFILIALLTRS